jgi:hypothetical protein
VEFNQQDNNQNSVVSIENGRGLSRAKAGFKEITKWVKSGFLMIVPIYAKVSV